jgi:hypothetical protein
MFSEAGAQNILHRLGQVFKMLFKRPEAPKGQR